MKEWAEPGWWRELPAEAGSFMRNVGLAELTTIRVGGPAEVFAEFAGWSGLQVFLRWNAARAERVVLTLVGKGSNMVIKDGGIGGVVACLGKDFDEVRVEGQSIYAEAGAALGTVARVAREAGLDGVAFFGGIPGSVGGGLRMNAGAYGDETFNHLKRVWLLDELGNEHEVAPEFVQPRYRHTELPQGWLYKAGLWELPVGDKEEIRQKMRAVNQARSTTQPLHMPSSGSWFKNPVLPSDCALGKAGEKVNAWKVVDAAGCRGWREGGAQVSEQHCNFFVNTGNALFKDFEVLSERVEKDVLAKLGIGLEREVKFLGVEG